MALSPSSLALALAVTGLALYTFISAKSKAVRRPPGPKPLPILGNALDMPMSKEWLTFTAWKKSFGDLVYVNVMGRDIVVCNSTKTAVDLLEKRSAIYSDRPYMAMAGDLIGYDKSIPLVAYGDRFRESRKLLQSALGPRPVEKYRPLEEKYARVLLQQCIDSPDRFMEHIRYYIGGLILKISHGYDVKAEHDPLIDLADRATAEFSLATTPGAFVVDFLPFLRHIPTWFPGASFKKTAARWKKTADDLIDIPWVMVERAIKAGTGTPSFTQNLIETRENPTPAELDIYKWAATGLYSGGADTSVSAVSSMFLALTCYPEVAAKARAEIDAVVGHDRLPTFTDRPNLPYVDAVLKEVLRWNPVGPLGIPHRLMEDDVYEGYHLPKGSLVISNIWGILHDEETYGPDPMKFDPERFLGANPQTDPHSTVFGYGRRICPGLHLADQSVWLALATVVASLDLQKPVLNGRVVEPEIDYTSGAISHPKPFQCDIKPRSAETERLIRTLVEHS